MAETVGGTTRQEIVDVIRTVRSRWRAKLLLRGALVVVGGGLLALGLASWGLQAFKFSTASVVGFRIAIFAIFAALVAWWFLRPFRRRVTDLQVALYVEEHDSSLQAAILSAVDAGATRGLPSSLDIPPIILERMIEQAVQKCRTTDTVGQVGRLVMRRYAIGLGVLAAIVALLLWAGPEFFRQGASALLVLSRDAEAASPYAIKVEPGDATVPKGGDQSVKAKLAGFRSNNVVMMVKSGADGQLQRLPLVPGADDVTFEGMLFDVKAPLEYFIEADGVRSPTYAMKVVELPAVENLELEYVYPAYTGLASKTVESGGDVAALRGTEVRVHVKPTMSTPAGRLQLEPGSPAALNTQTDGTLIGGFTIADDGFYHVELDGPHGEKVAASPKFTIDAIDDQPPTVTFEKPKRDTKASPIEEVFLQARADDDYGVKQLDLIYTVNGGAEKTVSLFGKGAKALTTVSAGHTLYLEELGVKPGDFVSYYAKATDTDTVKGPKSTMSDIYFIEVRPFSQDFKKVASQAGGGGGGGGGGAQAGALSEQQRQIISATFNVDRDRPKLTTDKFKENAVFVGLSQGKLREQVDDLITQMRERLGTMASANMKRIFEMLPVASAEMKTAEASLAAQKPKEALPAEQRALKSLQEAEQLYDLEVRQGGGGGGGGGGAQAGNMADELADLFQLQLDRQANQYELQQNAAQQQQNAGQQVDALAERLRDLARRQLEQAREQQQQQQRGQQAQGGSGGGAGQRALADEAEQAARQLEQLKRDAERQGEARQDLADAARRLQESANAMRQAAANGNSDGGAQARQAADAIQQAQRLLQQNQSASTQASADDAVRRADDLVRQQKEIAAGVQNLGRQQGAARDGQMQQLSRQKDALRNGVSELEQQLDTLGRQALSSGQRDAARKFQEAAGTIRDQATKEIIDYSKQAMAASAEASGPVETRLSSNLDAVRQRVGQAADAARQAAQGTGLNRAAQQAASVLRGLNALQEQQADQNGQQGQGQQGQQGGRQSQQEGRQGGQGQSGQQGGQQQGQRGEGQGQQGQGQQGRAGQGQSSQQGQGQGQGQQGQGGQGQRSGQGGGNGDPGNTAMGGDGRPGGAGNRQFRNQAGQLANDAQELRRQLAQSGGSARDLQSVDDVIRDLRAMTGDTVNADPANLEQLSAAALDKMKKLEFDLRKRTDTTSDEMYLSGADEAPTKYRPLVDEYFRALSKGTTAPKAAAGK